MPGTEGKNPKIACYVKKNWNRLLCKKNIIAYYAKIIIILGSIDGLMHDDWNLVGHVAGFQESGIG